MLNLRTGRDTLVDGRVGGGFSGYSWAPDGRRLVYALGDPAHGLWLANPDGGHRLQLTSLADTQPLWSPRGDRILFERDHVGLVAADLTGEVLRRFGEVDYKGTRAWSADGRRSRSRAKSVPVATRVCSSRRSQAARRSD